MYRMHGWVGRKDRKIVAVDAVVHCGDGTVTPVRLTDYSEDGCRIEGDRSFRIGERVRIEIPARGSLGAQVRWALLGSAGARFEDCDA